MLKQRIITAIVCLPIVFYLLIWADQKIATFFFLVCIGLSVFEISGLMLPALEQRLNANPSKTGYSFKKWQLLCVIFAIFMFLISTFGDQRAGRGGIVLGMSLLMLVGVFSSRTIERSMVRLTGFLVSICYGCLPWLAIWDVYIMGQYGQGLMLVIAIVMSNDTGAYFGGRHFGKRKLAKTLSPKKTWEGAFFGIISGVCGALLINALYQFKIGSWPVMVVAGIVGGIAGIMGDLVESAFKRFAGVKDSGKVFPGHGGFLDRVDSLLFAAPAVWFILYANEVFVK
ncbi:MAG: phosphatidate cytidylyltransferase [Bdellovibrionota bacterium]